MKKLLLLILVVTLVAILPYVTGRVAETVIQQSTQEINTAYSEYGTLQVNEYERGYLTTQATVAWQPPQELQALRGEPVIYQCEGRHGFISFKHSCVAQNVPAYTEFVNEVLSGQDPLVLVGEVSVLGKVTQRAELAAFQVADDSGDTLTVEQGYLELSTDQEFKDLKFAGEFAGLRMRDEQGEVHVKPLTMTADLYINQFKLGIGQGQVDLQGVDIQNKSQQVQLSDLQILSSTTEQGEHLATEGLFKIASLRFAGDAEPLQLTDIALETRASGVNMQELSELIEHLNQLGRFSNAESLSADQESTRNAEALALLPELEDVLTAGLNIGLEFSAKHAGDAVQGKISAELLKDLSLGDFILLTVQPQAFLNKFNAQVSNKVPLSMLASAAQAQAAMEASPFYQKRQDHFELDLRVADAAIYLNDEVLSIEEFMGLLMPSAEPSRPRY